jgi:hypothetical protein
MPRRHPPTAEQPAGKLVQFVPPQPARVDYDRLAGSLLAIADEVVADEATLKREAIAAIDRGDAATARRILDRWLTEPPADIVASLKPKGKRCG